MKHSLAGGIWWGHGAGLLASAASGAPDATSPSKPPLDATPKVQAARRASPPYTPLPWKKAVDGAPVRFNTDVVPILTKAGCNQGACHGAQAGQNGFRLSLRGWDPAFDWEQMVKDANGKRIDKAHPEKSLVYLKPTGQVSHGGGQRFKPDSPEAQVLLRWLKEGAQAPDDKLSVREVSVTPVERVLPGKGDRLQFRSLPT